MKKVWVRLEGSSNTWMCKTPDNEYVGVLSPCRDEYVFVTENSLKAVLSNDLYESFNIVEASM